MRVDPTDGRLAPARLLLLLALIGGHAVTGTAATPARTLELTFDPDDLRVEVSGHMTVVRYPGADGRPTSGEPRLPVLTRWVELPAGHRIAGFDLIETDVISLGRHALGCSRPERRADGTRPLDAATPAGSTLRPEPGPDGLSPRAWATIGAQGALRGHQVATLRINPCRWNPDTGELQLARRLRLRYRLEATAEPLPRHRIVPAFERRFERVLRRLLPERSGPPAASPGVTPGDLRDEGFAGPGPFQPTFRPTTDGSPVEYVIVTNEALAGEFERLAEWKSRKGVQAVVRTLEWIDDTYPNGVDRAERIRFFIRDAYQNWGTLFVLLGGDSDVVPPRYGETTFYGGESMPADVYYAALEGNWNADGDERFGEGIAENEPGDEADLFFEVAVGRAPVSTVAEARVFVDKTLVYEVNPPVATDYPATMLVMAERLFATTHGADIAEQAIERLPPWFEVVRLYEESYNYPGSIELTDEAAIEHIEQGFGIVHHVGHGFRNTMSVGAGTINNADADNFTNGPRNSVVFAINCSSASFDFNTIGERWLKNPDGGAIAYIGTSRLAFASASNLYQNAWFQSAFIDSIPELGLVSEMARAALALNSEYDGSPRWNLMSTTLLGDPEVDLYWNRVTPLEVEHPATYTLGSGPVPVTVTAGGEPVAGATVTLVMADGSTWSRALTAGDGEATLQFLPAAAGEARLTVHKTFYQVYETEVTVAATASPYLIILDWSIDDDQSGGSSGDGDGLVDAGETVELTITLRNNGGAQVTGVSATITADDPLGMLALLGDTVSYGSLAAGGSSVGSSAFRIAIDDAAPEAYQPLIELTANAGQGSWTGTLALGIHRPYIEHVGHEIDDSMPRGNGNGMVEGGEEIWYALDLRNSGQHDAHDLAAALRVLRRSDLEPHPLVTVLDGTSSFGTLEEGDSERGEPFKFELGSAVEPSEILLEVTLSDQFGAIRQEFLDVESPAPVHADSLRAFGATTSITLRWRPPADADVRGYDVWRADAASGPFERLNRYTIDGTAAFEDAGLSSLTRYYYEVVVRDSSMNVSPASALISASTNPPASPGWPVELAQQGDASTIIANLDGGPDFEIFTAADMVYAWHGNGEEVVDGDFDSRTSGPFSHRGYSTNRGFGATTALGDLVGDDRLEVVDVGWTVDSVFVWDAAGQILDGWPKDMLDDYNWGSPVLADVDIDGDLEIIVWSGKGGRLFAWHHDGVELVDGDNNPATDGVLARIYGNSYNYSCPVICNLDADPWMEIVVTVNLSTDNSGGVYAFNIDGTPVPGWPFFTGEPGHNSQVSASPAAVDFDDDGLDEIVVSCERDGGTVYVLESNGTPYPGWPVNAPAWTSVARLPSPSIADVDGDSELDIVLPGTSGWLRVWDRFGNLHPGFPANFMPGIGINHATQSTASVGDVDGDGMVEILFGDESGLVHAFNHDGTLANGFPIRTHGEVRSTPAIWDLDADNLVEVAVLGFDGNLYVWDLPFDFRPDLIPWPFFRHDTRNTGSMATDILPNAVGEAGQPGAPRHLRLEPAPNPMSVRTRIAFELPGDGAAGRPVALSIYAADGRLIRRLDAGLLAGGRHSLAWDGRMTGGAQAASGVYFLRLEAGDRVVSHKLTLVR